MDLINWFFKDWDFWSTSRFEKLTVRLTLWQSHDQRSHNWNRHHQFPTIGHTPRLISLTGYNFQVDSEIFNPRAVSQRTRGTHEDLRTEEIDMIISLQLSFHSWSHSIHGLLGILYRMNLLQARPKNKQTDWPWGWGVYVIDITVASGLIDFRLIGIFLASSQRLKNLLRWVYNSRS